MRTFILAICAIFGALCFNNAFSADTKKYSCNTSVSSPGVPDFCPDKSFKFLSPEEAAESVTASKKAYWKSQMGTNYYSYSSQYPTCTQTINYYEFTCTWNANLKYYQSGQLIETGYKADYVTVWRQHDCEPTTILKGSTGSVITNESDGKRYVLSRSPGESVCANSCNYGVKNSSKCYLTIGSETEGFCNYNYAIKVVDGSESCANSDTNIKPAEIGDELSDKCPQGYEFANGSKMCTPVPCLEGFERLDGSETCTPIPQQPGSGGANPGGGDGSANPGGGTNPGGGDGGTNPGDGGSNPGEGSTNPGGGDGGTNPGGGGGSNPGGGDGGTNPGASDGDEPFVSPGPLNLSASVSGRGEKVKTQILDMKQKMVSSDTFTTAKSAFSGSSHSAAVCPVGSVLLFGKDIVFDSHCKLFDLIAPILKAVFMAIWSFLAIRIVLSA